MQMSQASVPYALALLVLGRMSVLCENLHKLEKVKFYPTTGSDAILQSKMFKDDVMGAKI